MESVLSKKLLSKKKFQITINLGLLRDFGYLKPEFKNELAEIIGSSLELDSKTINLIKNSKLDKVVLTVPLNSITKNGYVKIAKFLGA